MTGVVPQPGATFPYSEFSGFSRVPKFVTKPVSILLCFVFVRFFEVVIEKERILVINNNRINPDVLQKDLVVLSREGQNLHKSSIRLHSIEEKRKRVGKKKV
jgi:hypothetical protein